MQIRILTFQDFHGRQRGKIGSSIIRGEWLVNNWDEADYFKQGCQADCYIYQKVFWEHHIKDVKDEVKILDLCDPDWLKGEFNLRELSQYVDAITTSSEELARVIRGFADCEVLCIPDRLDLTQFPKKLKFHSGKAKQVVWFGYQHNADEVLPQVLPSLAKLGLSLLVVSDGTFNPAIDYGVDIINTHYEIDNAYYLISQADFAINPKLMTKNFKYKSSNKTLTCWALGLPVAETADDMEKYLLPEERNKEAVKRFVEIKKDWDIKTNVKIYKDLIQKICQRKLKEQICSM